MEAKLQKWGNSLGIRIPNNILKSLNLSQNEIVEIKEEDDKIIISKSYKKQISLKELFDKYNGKKLDNDFVWDDPVGKEIW